MTTTKYITWSGGPTGDYTCDGTHDEVEINSAFTWANSNPNNIIKMRGTGDTNSPHKYHIEGQIKLCSYVTWTAETGVCLWVPDGACGTTISNCVFPNGTPVIGQLASYITKVEICGFEIDGNCQNQSTVLGKAHGRTQSAGSGVERLIQLRGLSGSQTKASEIYIHDMNFHDAFGEAAHIQYATGVRIIDISASNHQHDCIYCGEVAGDDNEISDSMLYGITDSTIRLDNCQNLPVHDNYIYSYSGSNNNTATMYGHNGIQIANNSGTYFTLHTNNISVYNNYFTGKNLCGIWLNDTMKTSGSTAQNVHIYNNSFESEIGWADWASWSSGISIAAWGNGVIIENNVFDGCYANSIEILSAISSSSTHTVTVKNNNIKNTMGKRSGSSGGPSTQGWGIWNAIPTKFVVKAENNYSTGNLAGNYKGLTPSSESDTPISDAGPHGGNDEDAPDDPVTPTPVTSGIYIPTTSKIINTDFGYVQRDDDDLRAYINGVPINVVRYGGSGSKSYSESHSPSTPGSNLGDLDLKGSDIELTCIADSIDEIDQVMAAFAQRGRSFLELGGPFKGYFVSGLMPDHGSSYDKGQGDIPEEFLEYSVSFKTEFPYRESMVKNIRGRYVSSSGKFSSCDIHNGNLVQNPNFSSWTPDHNLQWAMVKRDAVDNSWQKVKYSPELMQWCACAKTGTNNRIMVSGPQLVTDLSGDYNTGIYTGDVTTITGGLAFGGTDGYVDIPLLDIANATNWTIYTKFSTTVTGVNQTLFGLGRENSNIPLCVIWVDSTGHAVFWHRDDTSTTASVSGGIVADGLVHEVCVVKSGTTYTMYVDAVLAGTTTAAIGQCSVDGANLGRTPRVSDQHYLTGNIYLTKVFSRAFTAAEVAQAAIGTSDLMQGYSTTITDDPGEFWA
ncbi:MAG: LamG-like jellyroll fold domain-containing protein, partial [Prevotella sp.]